MNLTCMRAPATRIGDIFEIPISPECKRYMQFIVVDSTHLGGWGIRVFKKHYLPEEQPSINEIVADDVDFYCLTYAIGHGVLDGWWRKYGKSKDIGNISDIVFRLYHKKLIEAALFGKEDKDCWWVWTPNQEFIHYETLPEKYWYADDGSLFPPCNVISRIKTGRWHKEPNVYDDYHGSYLPKPETISEGGFFI